MGIHSARPNHWVLNSSGGRMTEQTSLANFFTVLFSAAMAIMLGALYVLLPAFARVRDDPRLMPCLAYAGLLAATLFLADAANPLEHPAWAAIVAFLLAGYLPAPRAVWHLCVTTHAAKRKNAETITFRSS